MAVSNYYDIASGRERSSLYDAHLWRRSLWPTREAILYCEFINNPTHSSRVSIPSKSSDKIEAIDYLLLLQFVDIHESLLR